jgi:hypothetical protein
MRDDNGYRLPVGVSILVLRYQANLPAHEVNALSLDMLLTNSMHFIVHVPHQIPTRQRVREQNLLRGGLLS